MKRERQPEVLHKAFEAEIKKAAPQAPDLDAIRQFALRDVTADDVFCGSMKVCNTKTDRSHERFPVEYLQRFAATLPGKSLMPGHNYSELPLGRFYDASVIKDGADYALLGKFFVDGEDAKTVRAVELGVFKDVSIGFKAGGRTCDLCGKQYDGWGAFWGDDDDDDYCQHYAGQEYDGKTCTVTYAQPEKAEAMEASFVWLGCQYGAEVTVDGRSVSLTDRKREWMTKRAGAPPARSEGRMDEEMMKKAIAEAEGKAARLAEQIEAQKGLIEDGKAYRAYLRSEIQRKYTSCEMQETGEAILKSLPEHTSATEMLSADGNVQKIFDAKFPPQPQAKVSDPRDREKPPPGAKAWDPVAALRGRA